MLAGLGLFAAAWSFWPQTQPLEVLLSQSREWLRIGQFDRAAKLASQALQQSPHSTEALFLASQAAAGNKQFTAAADFLDRVEPQDARYAEAKVAAGEKRQQAGDCQGAEAAFLTVLATQPEASTRDASKGSPALVAARRLSNLYSVQGRSWERRPLLQRLLRHGTATLFDLQGLAYPEMFAGPQADLENFHQVVPNDDAPLVGLAVLAYRTNKNSLAAELARQAVRLNPASLQGQPLLGWLLQQQDDDAAWLQWRSACPTEALRHPLAWAVQGAWLEDHGHFEPAVYCYLQALARDADDAVANLRVGQALAIVGRAEDAPYFQWRAEQIFALQKAVEALMQAPQPTAESFDAICGLLDRLGRPDEAHGWRRLLHERFPRFGQAKRGEGSRRGPDFSTAERAAETAHPVPPSVAAADFSPPDWEVLAATLARSRNSPLGSPDHPSQPDSAVNGISFAERAAELGIKFTYDCGFVPGQGPRFMRQSFGGGVAAIDYDGDAWPDLYFTQGCSWPPPSPTLPPGEGRGEGWAEGEDVDRLYRQGVDGQFTDVTALAHLGDGQFSGGVAAGDFDNDGWTDLYVANLGTNSLYRNNGDGTFDDISAVLGELPEIWTASCLIADLNGDGTPDLFDATYLGGDNLHIEVCGAHACGPHSFAAVEDRLWLASGDGQFRECGAEAGLHAPLGHGLGVVAADFDGSHKLSLFVANDQTPNFFHDNQTTQAGGLPWFAERGMATGLAIDGWGRSQACMGVACGDADGDGSIDLFATNFVLESNVLYLNQGHGDLFVDATARCGLREPSMAMVGFGTQFIDADLDGWPDLIVANGHVDDFRDEDRGFQMRPQFFRNRGAGQFVELPAETLGPYFNRQMLGRGLARLDWNRDGREDVAISNLESPAALLANTTDQAGGFLVIQLRGVKSARDAFGTTVRINAEGRERVAQLTAGDGYMASNQRQLLFGLGDCERVDEVAVDWPSGLRTVYHDLPANTEWILIEGAPAPWPVPNRQASSVE